jgi:hypothetical protein
MRLRERRDRDRHDRRRRGLERRHPQPPAAQPGDRLQLGLGLGEARQDLVGVPHDRLARLGQPHAARAALHEHRAGLALERRDLLRDRRLRERERLGGGGERAAQRDLAEDSHTTDVKHQWDLYQIARTFICADGLRPAHCIYRPILPRSHAMSTFHITDPTVVIRAARGSDGAALADLARLDSQRPLAGEALVAEQDGAVVAALAGDRVIADPFRRTADVVELLRLRAGGAPQESRRRVRVRAPRLRAA